MPTRQLARTSRIRRISIATCSISSALLLSLVLIHTVTSAPAPIVHIEWQRGFSDVDVRSLERRFQLTNRDVVSATVWSYDLVDTSSANIAALFRNDAIVDTAFLDRETATIAPGAPIGTVNTWIGDRLPIFKRPGFAQGIVLLLFVVAATSGVLVVGSSRGLTAATVARITGSASASALKQLRVLVTRGIPILSADALGLFRMFFALGLAVVLSELSMADWAGPGYGPLQNAWLADWEWVRNVANRPELVTWLERALFGAIGMFAIGLWSRVAFGGIAAGLILWTLIRLHHTGTHQWAVLLITIVGLTTVRWGDGLSVDAVLRRRNGQQPADTACASYGFTVWFPGVMFGTAMAAAAFAKLYASGFNWIWNGSVKYHFVTDAVTAPVDWGLWIASHHWAAVVASAFAIAVEGLVIVAVFLKPGVARALLGLSGAGLLLGFYLFQNEVWYAWWLLLVSFFVPWDRFWDLVSVRWRSTEGATPARPSPSSLTPSQVTVATGVCLLQLFACVFQVEHQPLLSNYPMYSNTYASTAVFDEQSTIQSSFLFRVTTAAGVRDISEELARTDLDEPLRDALLDWASGTTPQEDLADRIRWITNAYRERSGEPLGTVTLLRDSLGFDWATGRLYLRDKDVEVLTLDTERLVVL